MGKLQDRNNKQVYLNGPRGKARTVQAVGSAVRATDAERSAIDRLCNMEQTMLNPYLGWLIRRELRDNDLGYINKFAKAESPEQEALDALKISLKQFSRADVVRKLIKRACAEHGIPVKGLFITWMDILEEKENARTPSA